MKRFIWLLFLLLIVNGSHAQPAMVYVQGGIFTMGCSSEQGSDCLVDEFPTRQVFVDDFEIGVTEVTQQQWFDVMGYNAAQFNNCGGNCPVEGMSWYDILVYCNLLSISQGLTPCYYTDSTRTAFYGWNGTQWTEPNGGQYWWEFSANGYRLPTEAEWEFAARGGQLSRGTKYSGSNNPGEVGWYSGNSVLGTTYTTKLLAPNELGLYDMSGNVWEYVWDWYDATYYTAGITCQPFGPTPKVSHVVKGGSYLNPPSSLRTSRRTFPGFGDQFRDANDIGFRLAKGAFKSLGDFAYQCGVVRNASSSAEGQILVVNEGGNPPFQVSWEGPVSGTESNVFVDSLYIGNLPAGTYNLTFSDAGGCILYCRQVVQQCNLEVTAEVTDATCAEASVKLSVNENNPNPDNYFYGWSDGVDTVFDFGLTIPNLTPGTYQIALLNIANSCAALTSATIDGGTTIELSCKVNQPVSICGQ